MPNYKQTLREETDVACCQKKHSPTHSQAVLQGRISGDRPLAKPSLGQALGWQEALPVAEQQAGSSTHEPNWLFTDKRS